MKQRFPVARYGLKLDIIRMVMKKILSVLAILYMLSIVVSGVVAGVSAGGSLWLAGDILLLGYLVWRYRS